MQREVAPLLHTVRRTLQRHAMLAAGDHVLVALSGGADSVATLAVLVHLAPRLHITLSAAHVHHGLRGDEADRDAALARAVAERLGCAFYLTRLSPALQRGGNTEERARFERYAALERLADSIGATKIATGHTRNDQAETVLLRLVRGCGPSGLAAILPVRDGRVIRPLLECERADVERFLAALGIEFCRDRSNDDRRFLRNRIRLDVLPLLRQLNPRIDRRLADLAALSQERERLLAASWPATVLSVDELRDQPTARRGDSVRRWLAAVRGTTRGLARQHVLAVGTLLDDGRPNRCVQVPGGSVLREYDRLRFVPRAQASPPAPAQILAPERSVALGDWRIDAGPVQDLLKSQSLPADLWDAVIDVDAAAAPLVVRQPVAGDRVRPCGMRGRKKLSDIFVDRKVPRAVRSGCPVVQAGPDIVWVPGVVRSASGLVGPQTRRVLWLRSHGPFQPLPG